MKLKSLQIGLLTLMLLLPATASAVIATSTNYTLDVADITGTGFNASSPSYGTTGITDENFNAESSSYNLCGGLPSEIWGCGITPPPPPPPPPTGGPIAGGVKDVTEEEIIVQPEIPEEEIPEHIIFPWDYIKPPVEPVIPEQPLPPLEVQPVVETVPTELPVERGVALEPVEGGWCANIACYGAARVLLHAAAPEVSIISIHPIILYVLALLLIILSALLILLSYWMSRQDGDKKLYKRA